MEQLFLPDELPPKLSFPFGVEGLSHSEQRDLKSGFELCGLMPAERKANITQVLWITQPVCSIRTKCHWQRLLLQRQSEIQLINSKICEFDILWMLMLTLGKQQAATWLLQCRLKTSLVTLNKNLLKCRRGRSIPQSWMERSCVAVEEAFCKQTYQYCHVAVGVINKELIKRCCCLYVEGSLEITVKLILLPGQK